MISPLNQSQKQLIADLLNRARCGWRVTPNKVITMRSDSDCAYFIVYDDWMQQVTVTLCKFWVREMVKRLKAMLDYSERTITRPKVKIEVEVEVYLEEKAQEIAPETPVAQLQSAARTVGVEITGISWFQDTGFTATLSEGKIQLGQITFVNAWGGGWYFRHGTSAGKAETSYLAVCELMQLAGALPY